MNLFIMPHPPIIVEEIGKGEEKKAADTICGMKKIAKQIKGINPHTIAVITPHGNVFSDALCINTAENLTGNFGKFGHPEVSFSFHNNRNMAKKMCSQLVAGSISCLALNEDNAGHYNISTELDHGVLVPLYFILKEYSDFNLIHISIGYLSKTEMYTAGKIISDILGSQNVLIASGDLSHKLSSDGPYTYDEMGQIYDDYIVSSIKNKEYINILDMDEAMLEKAGQCAHKPLELLIGAVEGYQTQSEVYSYEGPYGVGYMTAKIVRQDAKAQSVIDQYTRRRAANYKTMKQSEEEYVALARETINQYVKNNVKIDVPDNLSGTLYSDRKGVFVSIKKQGRLRGCIGTIEPTKNNIAQEIIDNAISASTRDPRFNEIQEHELEELSISVDVLFPPEPIKSKDELDVEKYGVIVTKGYKKGLLLPNLEGVDNVNEQVSIALSKAGIKESEKYSLERFKVVRHK